MIGIHANGNARTSAAGVGALVCIFLLLLLSSKHPGFSPPGQPWGRYAKYLILSAVLPVLIYHTLIHRFPWTTFQRTSRLAFLFAITLNLGLTLYRLVLLPGGAGFLGFSLTIAGSFGGMLLVTWRTTGLVEINAPPPDHVRTAVAGQHRFPANMRRAGSLIKRTFDISLSLVGLILSFPLWFLLSLAIWLEDPGPLFFAKVCVTKGGEGFKQLKFRSMVKGAEKKTGPVLATERDPRMTRIGTFLRKTALDELPQLINILKGDMSFVGPRPQRTILVHQHLKGMPGYALRHTIRPGLTGLAQVYGNYYVTPRQKLRYDLVYLEKQSFGLDLKLMFLSFWISLRGRWVSAGKKV